MKLIFLLVLLHSLSVYAEDVEDWAAQKINEETGRHVNIKNLFFQKTPRTDDVTGYRFLLMADPPVLCTAEFNQDQYKEGTFECSDEEEAKRTEADSCGEGVAEKIINVANTAVNKIFEMPDDLDVPMIVPYYEPEIPQPDTIQLHKVLECKIEAGKYVLKVEGTQGDMKTLCNITASASAESYQVEASQCQGRN